MKNRAYERLLEYQDGTVVVTTHIQQEIYPELWKTYVMTYIEIQNEIQPPILIQSNISVDIPAEPKLMAMPIPPKSSIPHSTVISTEGLNGWLDGNFEQDFSWQEVEETSNLSVYRAVRVNVGDHQDKHAESWQKGKKSSRRCMGIIECDNATFNLIARPQLTPKGIYSSTSLAAVVPCLNTKGAMLCHSSGAGRFDTIRSMTFTQIK